MNGATRTTTPPTPIQPHLAVASMDRRIEKRRPKWLKIAAAVGALAVLAVMGYVFVKQSAVNTYALPRDRVAVSTVTSGMFLDFIPIRGNVMPLTTVYLDAVEGGRVEKLLVEEGQLVQQGEPLLELSNTALQLDVISREAEIAEQMNNLRNTRLATEQNRLALKNTLVEIDYQIVRLGRLAESRRVLFEQGVIARRDYEDTTDELDYFRKRRLVALESQREEERLRGAHIRSLETAVDQLQRNLIIARKNLDGLTIRAPISGRLTALSAELGESKDRGERLGQVDDVDDFKIRALVDEYYVTRMMSGQTARFTLGAKEYPLTVTKVFSEIREGQFEADLAFTGERPPNLRRGQTLQIRVALGDATPALLLPRGGFSQDTGGNWAFVLDPSGKFAQRRPLRLGRRNPE